MYDRDGAKAFPDTTSFLSHGQFDELKKQQNTPSLNLWTNVQRKDRVNNKIPHREKFDRGSATKNKILWLQAN